jgi:hypothetical protein
MGQKLGERKILTSWKEIASYLGVNARTAQRWEGLGLPIYRVTESQKTAILAYTDEIDHWLREKNGQEKTGMESRLGFKKLVLPLLLILLSASIILFFLQFYPKIVDKTPSDFKIEGSKLLIFNKSGKKLWDHDFGVKFNLAHYLPQNLNISKSLRNQNIFFEDIDNDGMINIVFVSQTEENVDEKVMCFDQKGHLVWSCAAGREIKYGNQLISSDFDIQRLRVVDLDKDGFSEILLIADHKKYHPSRVLLLDHKGQTLGEYWNSGHLICVRFLDLNEDGLDEILMGGLNNKYEKACLVVLDCREIEGSSPSEEGTRYHPEGLSGGTEKYYILFPQNEVGRILVPYETIDSIDLFENKKISACTTHSQVYFEFDYRMHPTMVLLGDNFKFEYRQLKKEGKIDTPYDAFDIDQIKSEILYWDGTGWTHEPTMTEFWKHYDE